jgi:hypothetical protein
MRGIQHQQIARVIAIELTRNQPRRAAEQVFPFMDDRRGGRLPGLPLPFTAGGPSRVSTCG